MTSWQEHVRRISLVASLMRAARLTALLAFATAVVLTGTPAVASAAPRAAAPRLDQSFTSPSNLTSAMNDCCAYIGQTFTAGRNGMLSGVSIDVAGQATSLPLRVAIRVVDSSGFPSSTVLGETVLDSSSSPLTRVITFPRKIRVRAGTQYAIVVNYQGAPPPPSTLGTWDGATGDAYPRGSALQSFDNGVSWSSQGEGFDLHFQTYVGFGGPKP